MATSIRCRISCLFAATFLAAPLCAAVPPARTGNAVIPFRHTFVARSADLTRPAKAVGDLNDDGFTRIDPAAMKISVALSWLNLGSFEDLLVARLVGAK